MGALTMGNISRDEVVRWLQVYADVVHSHADELNRLDAAQGDGDFGASMQRGVQGVIVKIEPVKDKDIGTVLKTVAMTLISTMGGTSGPLLGTLFLQMGATAAGKYELSLEDWTAALEAGVNGVMARGKAQAGDKTMLDAFGPAIQALKAAVSAGDSLDEGLSRAATAARQGAQFTATITATKGRASYVGERSLGHIDPGAMNAWLLMEAIMTVTKN